MRGAKPQAGSFVGASYERKERLQRFHTAFWTPGTLVTECFDWSVYEAMTRNGHQHSSTLINNTLRVYSVYSCRLTMQG